MEKVYNKLVFSNNNTPALNDSNLNLISNSLDEIDNRVCELMNTQAIADEAEANARRARAMYGKDLYNEWHGVRSDFDAIKSQLADGCIVIFTDEKIEFVYDKVADKLNAISNLTSNPNLLDNGFFTVNSRGASSYNTQNGYSADRWQLINTPTVTVGSGYLAINNTSSSNGFLRQTFDKLKADTYTLSAIVKGVGSVRIYNNSTYPANINISADNYTLLSASFTTTDSSANPYVEFRLASGQSVEVKAIKLERGSISTLANDSAPNYAEELLRCQTSNADASDTYANKGVATGDAWKSTTSYTVGQYFIHNNVLYRVKTACSGIVPPNSTYYEAISVTTFATEASNWVNIKSELTEENNTTIHAAIYNRVTHEVKIEFTNTGALADGGKVITIPNKYIPKSDLYSLGGNGNKIGVGVGRWVSSATTSSVNFGFSIYYSYNAIKLYYPVAQNGYGLNASFSYIAN